jgi:hypothetical protein
MDDDHDPTKPLSREERQQAELRRVRADNERRIDDEKARILAQDGERLKQQLDIKMIDDPDVRAAAAEEIAKTLATRGARAGQIDWRDHRDVPDKAIGEAQAKVEAQHRQEAESGKAATPELDADEAWYLNYTKEFAAKGDLGAISWLETHGYTPPAITAQAKQETKLATVPQEFGTPQWEAQAATPERLQRQLGRYDMLRGPPSSPGEGGWSPEGSPSPQPPTPPRPLASISQVLVANSGPPPVDPSKSKTKNPDYDYSGTKSEDPAWWNNAREILDGKKERSDRTQGDTERRGERDNEKERDGHQNKQTLGPGGFRR